MQITRLLLEQSHQSEPNLSAKYQLCHLKQACGQLLGQLPHLHRQVPGKETAKNRGSLRSARDTYVSLSMRKPSRFSSDFLQEKKKCVCVCARTRMCVNRNNKEIFLAFLMLTPFDQFNCLNKRSKKKCPSLKRI